MIFRNKQLSISILLMIVVALTFWLSSRYPALNEKAMMGDQTAVSGIAFNVVIPVTEASAWWEKITYNFVNWAYTNKQGMTFGLLFAAVLMLLITQLRKKQFENPFANSLLGMVIGAPLGVCVNCAAPIADGMHRSGGRLETSLAMMVSSPTLNVIIISMLIALFPLHMVVLKLVFTLVFVLLVIPLLVHFLVNKKARKLSLSDPLVKTSKEMKNPFGIDDVIVDTEMTWLAALQWVIVRFLKHLWYIIKIAVPLMLLAGLLGSAVITFVPWDLVSSLDIALDWEWSLLSMIVVALIAAFLPVPIAFDVVIVAVLMASGLPIRYSMILLFTLGIFSVYPWLLIKRSVSTSFAWAFFFSVVAFGLFAGASGHLYHNWYWQKQLPKMISALSESKHDKLNKLFYSPVSDILSSDELDQLKSSAFAPINVYKDSINRVSISAVPFFINSDEHEKLFTPIEGPNFGVLLPNSFSLLNLYEPFSSSASISVGDVNKDGREDVIFAREEGVYLYVNKGNGEFALQALNTDEIAARFYSAAFVDLNNDSWLDIFITTFKGGNYVLYNQRGSFDPSVAKLVPNLKDAALTTSPSFGDINRDGKLDVFLGNWTLGRNNYPLYSMDASQNALLMSNEDSFKLQGMPGLSGETFSTIISDLNNDGFVDVFAGNDFKIPDFFYLGNGTEKLTMVKPGDGLYDQIPNTTMSISTADLNNDLIPELFIDQITNAADTDKDLFYEAELSDCDEIQDSAYKKYCQELIPIYRNLTKSSNKMDASFCPIGWGSECYSAILASKIVMEKDLGPNSKLADAFPNDLKELKWMYKYDREKRFPLNKKDLINYLPQQSETNVLLVQQENKEYLDKAKDWGVEKAGWAWNAQFEDFDNDEFQDLFITNGYSTNPKWYSNVFYKNVEGKRMENKSLETGLNSRIPSNAWCSIDYDNDGDLDIVLAPFVGPAVIYRNNTNSSKNSIAFALNDEVGNYYGLNSRVYIYYGSESSKHQMREVQIAGGNKSFNSSTVYFGLNDFEKINKLKVVWSTGEETVINREFNAGSKYIIKRGEIN
jgi:uncharacterized membrane protein YraQ (UPF0718 family)